MKSFLISKGYYAVFTTEIEAENEEQALELAQSKDFDHYWKQCEVPKDDVLYQIEDESEAIAKAQGQS